ncbi:Asp-tRNAAsn/Glu-tRNAGln amidotransferase subunit B-like protein [Amycolatopsis vancoresmycina DSM 44592]|uniref:Asp-tRNAAsn/Glu-tRNAGln amidotransferase subunit B-like protein n=2 Tax=Amycolatopsis vancoresmycina TaxID=208444 RepID=R1IDZ5_9PSEU|nr:Asp-tRNAAsn/Glu-tRNAGln amidotransferase subunit B-like protein [Amycolatopsis vancoresmycina DSM 44592]
MFTVLAGLGTRLADAFAAGYAELLELPAGPPLGRPATRDDVAEFRAACRRELAATTRALDAELARTSLMESLWLAILFGQGDDSGRLGTPNVFTHEMEFLASCLSRVISPSLFSRDSLESALRALALARRHEVLDGQLTLTGAWMDGGVTPVERWEAHDQLGWSWRSGHGAFPTRYDWAYSLRLAQRIRERGGDHPDLGILFSIHQAVMTHWSDVLREFRATVTDPALRTVLRERTLLHLPGELSLSEQVLDDLARAGARLLLEWPSVDGTLPERQRREASQWRRLLTADPATLGRNTTRSHVFASPLAATPLVEAGDVVLYSLPHLVSTDLSQLVERVFSRLPNLPYYRARGEVVEEAALEHLAGVFPGARVVRGGKYRGTRPGELIEVDGVLAWEDVVLVLEGKGGYLSTRSRLGDPAAAGTELRRTVGDGFFQITRLIRALDRDGHVTLTGPGEPLTLHRAAIRRIYAVVPTADTFDPLSTLLDLLRQQDILPAGAVPAILAVPELHLLTELLPTPAELLAYLEYREEVLAMPQIRTGGELELLAAFSATIDIVGTFRELDAPRVALSTDHQEKYLDPWLQDSFHAWVNGLPPVPPPRRNAEEHRAKIERFLAVTHDAASATVLHQLTGAQLRTAELHAERVPRLRRRTLSPVLAGDLAIVVAHPDDPIDTVRAARPVCELRARSRWIVYLTPGVDGAEFRYAERGGAHVFGEDRSTALAEPSRLGAVTDWFDRTAARRHSAHRPVTTADREHIDALVRAGVPETLALGLTRLSLTTAVLDVADRDPGIGLTQAADFYLTHVRRAAEDLEVATADLALGTAAACEILQLVISGRIRAEDAAALTRQAVHHPETPPEELARSASLLTDRDDARLAEAVQAALSALDLTPDQVRRSQGKQRRRTRDRLLGTIRRNHPSLNPRAVATEVEALWE